MHNATICSTRGLSKRSHSLFTPINCVYNMTPKWCPPVAFVPHAIILLITCISSTVSSINPFVLEEQIIWESGGQGEVSHYRIPLLIHLPNGDLLAFSEARKYSIADAGAKFIAMRRSSDGGESWGPSAFILDDYKGPHGMNLGTITVNCNSNTLILIYVFCVHSVCNGTSVEKPSGVYMVSSPDWGYSWSTPLNLADMNPLLSGYHWHPGPGYGIQKKYHPHKGRLITCGPQEGVDIRSLVCLYSDDGVTWKMAEDIYGIPYGQGKTRGDFVPGEVQIVELNNGTILANIRNTYVFHCHCRIQALSFDGGETFPSSHIRMMKELVSPNVCGSLLNFRNIVFFSNPYHESKRANMTVHWSTDNGQTYPQLLNIYEKGSSYSCLAPIDENHIGMLYEKDNCKYVSFVKIQLDV